MGSWPEKRLKIKPAVNIHVRRAIELSNRAMLGQSFSSSNKIRKHISKPYQHVIYDLGNPFQTASFEEYKRACGRHDSSVCVTAIYFSAHGRPFNPQDWTNSQRDAVKGFTNAVLDGTAGVCVAMKNLIKKKT